MHQKIKNLSIRHKLRFAFRTIIVLCMAAAMIGAFGIGTVFTSSRTLYNDFGQSQGAVNRLLADFKQNELLTGSLLLNPTKESARQLTEALQENKTELMERFEQSEQAGYFDYLSEEKITQLETLLQHYFAIQTQVEQLAAENELQQATALFTNQLLPEGEAVDETIQTIITAQEQSGRAMLMQLGSTTSGVVMTLGGFALTALVCSVVITVLMSVSIDREVKALMDGMEHLSQGILSTRVPVLSLDDLGRISEKFNKTCEALETYVTHVNQTMGEVARGRLIYDDEIVFQGDFLAMQKAMMEMIQNENHLICMVQATTEQVSAAAQQVSAASQNLAQGATEQASSVEQLSSAVSEFSKQMNKAVTDAASTSEKAQEAGCLTEQSKEKMEQMREAMTQIYAVTQQMDTVVESIENIAFQTNLLALNAAVEAARAGQAGTGFAVIARTVSQLAQKSSQEAKETAALLQSARKAVEQGRELTSDAFALIGNTARAAEESAAHTEQVLSVLTEQSNVLKQIDLGLEQISVVIQNNSAASEESAAASQQLYAQSTELERHVKVFSVK